MSYVQHTRWALRYSDRHFRLDPQFIFQAFGVMQKRQVYTASSLQIKKSEFQRNEIAIRNIDANTLLESSKEEMQKKPISNQAVSSLKRHLSAVQSKVMGTDESRRGQFFFVLRTFLFLTCYDRYPLIDMGYDDLEVSTFVMDYNQPI